jgi:hypothetical protein
MGVHLATASQSAGRFEFVLRIHQPIGMTTVIGSAGIFEFSVSKAVLEIREDGMTRLEVADALLARCMRWAHFRMGGVPSPSPCGSGVEGEAGSSSRFWADASKLT